MPHRWTIPWRGARSGLSPSGSADDRRTAEARGRERYRRAGLTAATALGGRGVTVILSLATVPLALGYLGPERFGIWLTISSVIALLALTDLGIGNGLLNAVTQAMARGDIPRAQGQSRAHSSC